MEHPAQLRTRTQTSPINIADNRRLTFYASVFDSPAMVRDMATPLGMVARYRETIKPGAFKDALSQSGEVLANIDHDASRTFARRTTGELLLQEDSRGLFATCELPRNELGDHIRREVEAGRLRGCSVQMRTAPDHEQWTGSANDLNCDIVGCSLQDVCLNDNPAYQATDVRLRTDSDRRFREWLTRLRVLKIK
ncbi:HK97 family phage prohead protease [Zavarzinella formosa]|uniref:HK97 family phage prohead protease n=1 Tax=Zavarzinella formosa TaxID=360055 RepID=UPI000A077D3D